MNNKKLKMNHVGRSPKVAWSAKVNPHGDDKGI